VLCKQQPSNLSKKDDTAKYSRRETYKQRLDDQLGRIIAMDDWTPVYYNLPKGYVAQAFQVSLNLN
jgi:hypothetical protein